MQRRLHAAAIAMPCHASCACTASYGTAVCQQPPTAPLQACWAAPAEVGGASMEAWSLWACPPHPVQLA